MVEQGRIHVLRGGEIGEGCVLYWMSREQRARDNWALLYELVIISVTGC